MKIALLGGGNCYALNLARMALSLGHQVMGVGRSPLRGLAFTLGVVEAGYEYHVFQVGPDNEFILDLVREWKPRVIVNYAAQGEGQASFEPRLWKHFYRTNTQSLVELTELLAYASVFEKFIQIGTSELYGSVKSPSKESDALRPTSPYAASKAAFDLHLCASRFSALVVRPSNAFCPGQQLHRIIPKTLVHALTGRKVPLHGGGLARKSYLFADDLSRAVLLLAERGQLGEVYNCGPTEPVTIKRLIELVAQSLGKHPDEIYEDAPGRYGEDSCYWLDSSKLRSLGWAPQVPLLGGIAHMKEWIEAHPELLTMSTDWRIRA
jgi:dTDP-glucose 4,6-dehydratase